MGRCKAALDVGHIHKQLFFFEFKNAAKHFHWRLETLNTERQKFFLLLEKTDRDNERAGVFLVVFPNYTQQTKTLLVK